MPRKPGPKTPKQKAGAPPPAAAPASAGERAFAAIMASYESTPGVTAGRLFASNGLKVNGRIFAMVVKGHLVVKLPRSRVDALVAAGDGERFDPGHGRIMKEWFVQVGRERRWPALTREAFEFVSAG